MFYIQLSIIPDYTILFDLSQLIYSNFMKASASLLNHSPLLFALTQLRTFVIIKQIFLSILIHEASASILTFSFYTKLPLVIHESLFG